MATEKLRGPKSQHEKGEKRKKRELGPTSSCSKENENKIDEMHKLIKIVSSNISKLEMKNKNQKNPIEENYNQNFNQYRRPLNPVFFCRYRKNN